MNEDKEKWMEDVFQSMKGSQRAKPRQEVFTQIKSQIKGLNTKVVSLRQWKFAAAAAVLILMLNIFALRQFVQSNNSMGSDMLASSDSYNQAIISDYKIYE